MLKKLTSVDDHNHYMARIASGALLLTMVVIGFAIWVAYDDRLELDQRAHTNVRNVSLLLERDISAEFERIDMTLRTVAEEAQRELANGRFDGQRINDLLALQQSHLPEIISLRVTDETGLVRYGKGVVPGAVDLSDRDFFIRQRDGVKPETIITAPVLARISNTWTIPVSRRINWPDGRFAGVVYANIPVEHFTRKFSQLELGRHGLVTLRSASHLSMARFPQAVEGGGAPGQFALSDQLRQLLVQGKADFTYVAPSPTDHIERIYGYTSLKDYPLYVVVGIATSDYLDEWWRDVSQTFGIVLLFVLGLR